MKLIGIFMLLFSFSVSSMDTGYLDDDGAGVEACCHLFCCFCIGISYCMENGCCEDYQNNSPQSKTKEIVHPGNNATLPDISKPDSFTPLLIKK